MRKGPDSRAAFAAIVYARQRNSLEHRDNGKENGNYSNGLYTVYNDCSILVKGIKARHMSPVWLNPMISAP